MQRKKVGVRPELLWRGTYTAYVSGTAAVIANDFERRLVVSVEQRKTLETANEVRIAVRNGHAQLVLGKHAPI